MEEILVLGASGATGRLLVEQLLDRELKVRVIVRSANALPAHLIHHKNISVITASVCSLSDSELSEHIAGCHTVISCLGHNLSFKGIFGPPYQLVTDTLSRCCAALQQRDEQHRVKFILMNTTGNRNRDLTEKISFAQKCVMTLLRLLLPPHRDNEQAADYLRTKIGQENPGIEWVAVRPDGLIDETQVTQYQLHGSPTRSAIFDAGTTSRINVGHFMAELVTDEGLWQQWKGQMPVIYNGDL